MSFYGTYFLRKYERFNHNYGFSSLSTRYSLYDLPDRKKQAKEAKEAMRKFTTKRFSKFGPSKRQK